MGCFKTFWIGENRHVTVKILGSETHIVIRECSTNAQGKRLMSGKKGINLTVAEWCRLAEQCHAITLALKTCLRERDLYLKNEVWYLNMAASNISVKKKVFMLQNV